MTEILSKINIPIVPQGHYIKPEFLEKRGLL